MTYIKWLAYIIICTALLESCSSGTDGDLDQPSAILSEPLVSEVTSTSAYLQVSWSALSATELSKSGFCYSTSSKPTIYNSIVLSSYNNQKNFSARVEGLSANTIYYVRAFVVTTGGEVIYSDQIEFTTIKTTEDPQLTQYKAPAYADNYAGIADWNQRSRWNLANVHDPTVVLAEDGYFYMYQTDASYGNAHVAGGHFHGRRSKDLVTWEYLGGVMKKLPDWVIPKLNEIRVAMGLSATTASANDFGYWAPCVRKVKDGLYRMYYSIVCPGLIDGEGTWGERAFIGMMENSNPADNEGWVDKGFVITNASDRGLNYHVKPNDWANCYYKWNAIDPSYIITPENEHWLIYGSWHSGIVALELNGETGKPKQTLGNPWADNTVPTEYGKLIFTRQAGNRWQGSEAPEVVYNAKTGYYYLFVAYDALDIPYNTRVARSKNISGPYYGIDGKNVSEGGDILPIVTHPYKFSNSDGWVGIAHCAIFEDGNGNWYYSSQGRLPESVNIHIMMGHVRSIRWTDDGWPVVMPERYGAVPKVAITEAELIGNWEHINLSYSYGRQKESTAMVLNSSKKVSKGSWDGASWSYDSDKQILTIGGTKLYLQREVDWEVAPRTHTIVYSGLDAKGNSLWGKKVK